MFGYLPIVEENLGCSAYIKLVFSAMSELKRGLHPLLLIK